MKISEILRKLRTERNISQTAMAKKLNITRQAYNHYETGRCEPDYSALVKIAGFFDVSTDYILQNTNNPKPIKQSEKEKEGEIMNEKNLDGKPVTQAQFRKLEKNMANMATKDDINKILEAINSIQANTESGQDEPAFKN